MESNPITPAHKAHRDAANETVNLSDPQLAKITRLRLISDPGDPRLDLSYCYGTLRDGTPVRVRLPWYQFTKANLHKELVQMCKEANVYGVRLNIFGSEVVSICT